MSLDTQNFKEKPIKIIYLKKDPNIPNIKSKFIMKKCIKFHKLSLRINVFS